MTCPDQERERRRALLPWMNGITSKAECTVTSCQPGIDHSSSKLSKSISLSLGGGRAQQLEQQRQPELAQPGSRGRF